MKTLQEKLNESLNINEARVKPNSIVGEIIACGEDTGAAQDIMDQFAAEMEQKCNANALKKAFGQPRMSGAGGKAEVSLYEQARDAVMGFLQGAVGTGAYISDGIDDIQWWLDPAGHYDEIAEAFDSNYTEPNGIDELEGDDPDVCVHILQQVTREWNGLVKGAIHRDYM